VLGAVHFVLRQLVEALLLFWGKGAQPLKRLSTGRLIRQEREDACLALGPCCRPPGGCCTPAPRVSLSRGRIL